MSCSNLMKVKFPETLKEIDETCFANCVSLTSLTLTGVETIGERAFYNCIYNHRTTKTNQKYPSVNL